jgi:HEAT repeat protein/ActR/RegA family two-component response regulator
MESDRSYEGAIRVLHVEDELGAIKITRVYLEKAGYNNFEITPVLTAEQALEKLENEDFDVVISDYMMPGMDGLKFLEELRKKGNDIPFIIFTGRGEEGVAIEALNKGANRYIKKEGRPDVLFNTLGRYVREVVGAGTERNERGDVDKIQPLSYALEDSDWSVRVDAVEALGKMGDTGAVEPLIRALDDEDEDVRKSAAEALGKIGDTRAVESLIQSLKDRKRDVRKSAVVALGKIGEPAVESLIPAMKDELTYVRLGAVEALGDIGAARAVEPLITALKDENQDIKWSAAETLGKIGEPAVEPLIQTLKNEDRDIRWSATEVLGAIGDARAVKPLIRALNDKAEYVRMGAAWALGKIGDASAVEPLFHALKDMEKNVRKAAAEALINIGEPAIEHLIIGLRDKNERIRKQSAEILGKIGDMRAVEPLFQAVKREEVEVRKTMEKALAQIHKDEATVQPRAQAQNAKKMTVSRKAVMTKEERVNEDFVLSPKQIKEIKDLHARGYRESDIAKKLDVPGKSVINHLKGERARRLEEQYKHIHRVTI